MELARGTLNQQTSRPRMDFFYNDIWRMDWGFGNPNKTAALIAMLMVAVWWLALIRRCGFWIALPLFTALGFCLVHTFSRGGMAAAALGLLFVAWRFPGAYPGKRVAAVIVSMALILAFGVFLEAHERLGQGVGGEDRSIGNRLDLWKAAPGMMVDAPGGWGLGNSGDAFMQWYQPVERTERYRTMVNSHLTWLVEFSWLGRFLYLAGWGAVLLLCWPERRHRWFAVAFGIWTAFAISAFFSSVAEEPLLWVTPLLALAVVMVGRWWQQSWPRLRLWAAPPAAAAVLLLMVAAMAADRGRIHSDRPGRLVFGDGAPQQWVVVDRTTLGSLYGKELRSFWKESRHAEAIGIVESLQLLPEVGGSRVILTGLDTASDPEKLETVIAGAKELLLVNPKLHPEEVNLEEGAAVTVLFGEFFQSPMVASWNFIGPVERLPGVGEFIPAWPETLLSTGPRGSGTRH